MDIDIDGPEVDATEEAKAPEATPTESATEAAKEPAPAAPESPPAAEPVSFSPEQQEVFNAAIGRRVAAQKEAERQLAEARQQLEAIKPTLEEGEPVIPPPPDLWEDGYEQKLAARDEAIAKHAESKLGRQAEEQRHQAEEQRQQEAAQQEMMTRVQTYTERAKGLGIAESDLQVAGNAVAQMGVDPSLVNEILA